MRHCLWCAVKMERSLSWENMFVPDRSDTLCAECVEKFEQIKGPYCKVCCRKSDQPICADCEKWHSFYQGEDPLQSNVSIFTYNDFMKQVMTKWKYRGDYELVYLFKHPFIERFKRKFLNKDPTIIPIPLSKERLYDRGFNQSEALARLLSTKIEQPFIRTESEKQSKKSRLERMMSDNPFKLSYPTKETVVLVDDIYTTGRTLRHAAELLRKHGCNEIYSFTLIRG